MIYQMRKYIILLNTQQNMIHQQNEVPRIVQQTLHEKFLLERD